MNIEQRVKLWDAINAYAAACGGDPSKHVYGNTPRQTAVAEVERLVRDIERSEATGIAGDRCGYGNECGRTGCPECQQ